MVLKLYCVLLISTICVAKISSFEFQNLQMITYDENSSSYFGPIDSRSFRKIGDKYYWIETSKKMPWWDAYFTCRKHNSFLASVTLKDMETLLSSELFKLDKDGKYWVGGTDLDVEGAFRWMSTGENIPRGNMWISGEPNDSNRNENCVNIFREGETSTFRLNDAPCGFSSYFICERESPKAITFVAW